MLSNSGKGEDTAAGTDQVIRKGRRYTDEVRVHFAIDPANDTLASPPTLRRSGSRAKVQTRFNCIRLVHWKPVNLRASLPTANAVRSGVAWKFRGAISIPEELRRKTRMTTESRSKEQDIAKLTAMPKEPWL